MILHFIHYRALVVWYLLKAVRPKGRVLHQQYYNYGIKLPQTDCVLLKFGVFQLDRKYESMAPCQTLFHLFVILNKSLLKYVKISIDLSLLVIFFQQLPRV